MRTVIVNGTVVTASGCFKADVVIEGERIASLADPAMREGSRADRVIDAQGMYVMPGGVDVHTHLDMPLGDIASSDDFLTGTVAAAHGGTTTIIDYAAHAPSEGLRDGLLAWHARARGKAVIDYGFHMSLASVSKAMLDEMAAIVEEGVTSFKLFTAYPGRLYSDDGQILRAMQRARELGALVAVHAENGLAIEVLIEQALARANTEPRYHALTRPEALEAEATCRALSLAEVAGARVYIVHISSRRSLEEVARFRRRGLSVFAETCPHYLCLTAQELERDGFEGAKFVCSPPLRDSASVEALWQGLATGLIDVVATDHCPFHFQSQKRRGLHSFALIPNGLPGIETRLLLLWERGVRSGRIGPSRFVELVATAPAKIFGLYPRKGTLAPGADADIVVWDPNRAQSLAAQALHMRVDYSPYEGLTVHGSPRYVLSRGEVIVEDGSFVGRPGRGHFLRRHPSAGPHV